MQIFTRCCLDFFRLPVSFVNPSTRKRPANSERRRNLRRGFGILRRRSSQLNFNGWFLAADRRCASLPAMILS